MMLRIFPRQGISRPSFARINHPWIFGARCGNGREESTVLQLFRPKIISDMCIGDGSISYTYLASYREGVTTIRLLDRLAHCLDRCHDGSQLGSRKVC